MLGQQLGSGLEDVRVCFEKRGVLSSAILKSLRRRIDGGEDYVLSLGLDLELLVDRILKL